MTTKQRSELAGNRRISVFKSKKKSNNKKKEEALTSFTFSFEGKIVLQDNFTLYPPGREVPQYLLDHMWSKGEACKIVCTQPRRISAISVAERISTERGEHIGESVGYKIRMDTKGGRRLSIVFRTNGVLLRVLVTAGNGRYRCEASSKMAKDAFPDITHIIVDEIHERENS